MSDCMEFPNTWEEFERDYGFVDSKEIYTNGSRLIQSFRVKQWLDHIAEPERNKGKCTKINCPIQMNYISNDCDIKTCPYRTEYKKGKWKNVAFFTRECSECGAQFHELEYDNFCPNCGVDMRGE